MIKNNKSWIFLGIMIGIYIILFFLNHEIFTTAITFFQNILQKIAPIFVVIFGMMILVNKFVTPQFVLTHIKDSSFKSWFFIIVGGIVAMGPPYIWYSLLKTLEEKGIPQKMIVCFLYVKSISLPFFPVLILSFGLKYALTLSAVLIVAGIIQAFLVEKFLEIKKI